MLKTVVLLNMFVKTDDFFQDSLIIEMSKEQYLKHIFCKRKYVKHYKCLHSHFCINLMYPCWIKVFI